GDGAPVKFLHPLPGPLAQLVDRAELDRLGRAGLGAGGDEPVLLAVVAERTLVRMAAEAAAGNDAEGAGRHAVRAAVADVGLDVDVLELVMDDGARRTSLLAGGREAMLAAVAHHEPAAFLALVVGQHVQGEPR